MEPDNAPNSKRKVAGVGGRALILWTMLCCICSLRLTQAQALYQVPRDPKALNTTISHPTIQTHIHTLTVVGYIVATAALGQTDRCEVPLSPLTTITRQEGWSVLSKNTPTQTDRAGV
ncbi:hypothetical protein ATANTOWER_024423 [Ataeniobius toweri]|uniref:Uncharacterized protein n=1 Tax=Ataeniobius toweri TaxID=208326 RepID=A0ABU7C3I0_9TELE|nr:hypothetical protein [Ataeniobius toweri]